MSTPTPGLVVLRPRDVSRALGDAPDTRLYAGPDGLVLHRAGSAPEVLLPAGAVPSARWEDGAPGAGRLLLLPAGGPALALHEADWTDGEPLSVDGPPPWASAVARALGTALAGSAHTGPAVSGRRVHPDPRTRERQGLQAAYGLLSVSYLLAPLLALVPGLPERPVAALLLFAQGLALLGLVVVGALWLRGRRRLRAPLPGVQVELAPRGAGLTRLAAERLRLGARPGELVVRDERGAECSLPTAGTTSSRSPDAVQVLGPDGLPLLRLPLPVWAPDDDALLRLLDLLAAAGVAAGPAARGSAPGPREPVVPSGVVGVGGEVPGLPGYGWYGLAGTVTAVDAGFALSVVDSPAVRVLGAVGAAAVLVMAGCTAVAHRHRTTTLRHGTMGGSSRG